MALGGCEPEKESTVQLLIGGTLSGGTDKSVLFISPDGVIAQDNSNFNYDQSSSRLGIQVQSPLAPLHVDNVKGEGVAAPATLVASLVLDTSVNSPTGSASQGNSPSNPSGFGFGFTYIDQPVDVGQFTNPDYAGSGFTASGQSITYTVIAYRNNGPTRVACPNVFNLTAFNDPINDSTTQFAMDIGGWSAPNGYADGFILVRSDNTGTYQKDILNVTSYHDSYFTDSDAYVNSNYSSTGSNWSPGIAQYKSYLGTVYRTDYITNDTTDGAVSGAYLMISASWSAATDDGFVYRTATSSGFFDLTTGTSFADYGQSGGGDPYGTFSSVAFPYFDQSGVSDGSFSSNSQNDGTGSYTATNAVYNYFIYEYKVNPVTSVKYVTSGYAFQLNDNNDSQQFTWGVDLNAGTGDGRIWINTDSGTGGDIGGGTHFDDDGAQPAAPDYSHALGSYGGVTRNFSAYGLVTSPSTKYSATPSTYNFTDNNPTTGYIILHGMSTYGNAVGLKDIETSYRGPGYDFANTSFTGTSYIQTNTGLGDATITPSTLGYVAAAQTLTYHAFSKKTILSIVTYSSTHADGSITFPNDGLNYTVTLTIAAVSGATYRVNKVGTGWHDFASSPAQDNISISWSGSSTVTPTAVISTPTTIIDGPFQATTDLPQLVIRSTAIGGGATPAEAIAFWNSSNAETFRIGYDPTFPGVYLRSPNGIYSFKTSGSPDITHTRLGPTQLVLNAAQNAHELIYYSDDTGNPIVYAYGGSGSSKFFGINHNGTSADVSIIFSVRDTNNTNSRMLQLLGSGGSGDYISASGKSSGKSFIVDSNAHAVICGSSASSSVALTIGGQSSSVAALVIDSGTLKASAIANSIENDGTSLRFTNASASRRILLITGTTGQITANTFPIANSSGELIDSHLTDTGSLIIANLQVEFKQNITLDSGRNIGMGNGGSITGNIIFSYIGKTANYTLTPGNDFIVNATANSFDMTLPTAVSRSGQIYMPFNEGTGVTTLKNTSSQTINGIASGTITLSQNQGLIVFADGANWKSPGVLAASIVGTLANAQLANSTISGVSLGGTLAALTATDSTITFSGSYTGTTARTVGLNLGNANTWTAKQIHQLTTSQLGINYDSSNKLDITVGSTGTVAFTGTGSSKAVSWTNYVTAIGKTWDEGILQIKGSIPQLIIDSTTTGTQCNFELRKGNTQYWAFYVPAANANFTFYNYGVGADNLILSGTTGDMSLALGHVKITTVGRGIYIKEGTNALMGTGTLTGGTVTISTTAVAANSRIFLTDTGGGVFANIGSLTVGTIVAGTSFVVTSTNVLDSSTFNWIIFQPA